MRTLVLLSTVLACASQARRMQTAAAFTPSGVGSAAGTPTANRLPQQPAMQETKAPAPAPPSFDVKDLAGISAPLGFWDPLFLSSGKPEGTVRFWREVEIKHGRVAMLAAVGFLYAEQVHPLFGGKIDVPSYIAFQQTPLQTFWPVVLLALGGIEFGSLDTFEEPVNGFWSMKSGREPGDLGFDPFGIKPPSPKYFKIMQTKELNNGRLAMLAIAGMVAQEMVTGKKIF